MNAAPTNDLELVITKLIDATPDKVYRCWTDAALLPKWFAPKPWTTPRVELDVRPGGANLIVMAGPDGSEFPNRGVYLELTPNRKIVFTDAFTSAWIPSAKPFFVGTITFDDEGGKTRYTARAGHWTKEDRDAHEKMGFHEGWMQCANQLEELAKTL